MNEEPPGEERQDDSTEPVDPLPSTRSFIRYLDIGIHLICRKGVALPCVLDFNSSKLFKSVGNHQAS